MDAGYDSEAGPAREEAAQRVFEARRHAAPRTARKRPADFGKRFFEDAPRTGGGARPRHEPFSGGFNGCRAAPGAAAQLGRAHPSGFGLQQNNDGIFILSVIVLLMSEKADFMLIFALLYILM